MTDSHIGSTGTQRNILEYLKAQRLLPDSLDVEVKSRRRAGVLHVRQGQVIAAESGILQGNGAFLTLVAEGVGDVTGIKSEKPVEKTVSVTVSQVERFFATLPSLSKDGNRCDEEKTFQDALQLFFQFRRKEAGAKLVEVLRSNRFYYPAWLWHSRLLTKEDSIRKALSEASKWGNSDPSVKKEVQKIEAQFTGLSEAVRRCIFCWSLLKSGEECCGNCGGLQRISQIAEGGTSSGGELQQTLALYEDAMSRNPENSRIAYCLCLGFCSLGQIDRGREYIAKALKISPREPLFVRTSALLQPVHSPTVQVPVQKMSVAREKNPELAPVVFPALLAEKKKQGQKTVLVVEDSKTARKVISMVLGRKGYNILEATSGTEALLAIEGVTPNLVLLDVMLPDMTGYEILSTIRKKSGLADVPVVMLTSKSGAADRQKGMMSGSNEYLTKPFDPAKLLGVLGKYLDSSEEIARVSQPENVTQRESPAPAVRPTVPIKPAVVKPVAVQPALTPPVMTKPKTEGLKKSILVVEDSPTSRKVISMVLSRKGYAVDEAASGEEALSKVDGECLPNLILLDAMLPDMTGYNILALLKQDSRFKDIPVVMLTAKDSPVDREKGLQAGASDYLTKPFNPDKLLSVIGGYI